MTGTIFCDKYTLYFQFFNIIYINQKYFMNLGSIEDSQKKDPKVEYRIKDSFEIIETNFPTWTVKFHHIKRMGMSYQKSGSDNIKVKKVIEEIESNIREIKTTMQNNLLNLDNRQNDDISQKEKDKMAIEINLLLEEIETYLSQNYPAQKF